MDEMRAQWEALMGNLENPVDPNETKSFEDKDVCKMYLVGLCPHDLFENTKHYIGPCALLHCDELRAKYMEQRKTRYYNYEAETLRFIMPLIEECDRRVQRGRVRAEDDIGCKQTTLDDATIAEAKRIDAEIEKKMKIANELGEKGEVEESFKLLEEAELLKKNKLEMLEKAGETSYQSRIKPCDICGALLSATDTDRRLTEHYSGKIHVSYQKLRDMSKLLTEYLPHSIAKGAAKTRTAVQVARMETGGHYIARIAVLRDPAAPAAVAAATMGEDVGIAAGPETGTAGGGDGVRSPANFTISNLIRTSYVDDWARIGRVVIAGVLCIGIDALRHHRCAAVRSPMPTSDTSDRMAGMRRQVLVTVGTTSFDELIEAVDNADTQLELKRLGYTHIYYQIGRSSRVIQQNILVTRSVRFEDNFVERLRESELVISHMGAGTIIDIFRLQKKAVFVPNNKVADNHQMQLSRVMDGRHVATLDTLRSRLSTATETPGHFFAMLLPAGPLNEVLERTMSS
ncbi:U1 snRNP-associated Usp106 [Babesia ovata]|uniref:U1 snRNP-associated Usp106 n=1 Tax=Babesia ovata TaxID=189622 RepID=A0A2H6KCG9_9APIC|nr:U1 snRNP-associated Usp106 [Babesia ovata]GBE60682.1 U1 snRNP-associated Usp106 [Babesia ovata]